MAFLKKITFNVKIEKREFYVLPSIIYYYKWKSIYLGFLFFEIRIDWD